MSRVDVFLVGSLPKKRKKTIFSLPSGGLGGDKYWGGAFFSALQAFLFFLERF
ncbi:MAG: hypothetical protein RL757_482 [Bacteroidota bacterium]|jgi:hypothetical protein